MQIRKQVMSVYRIIKPGAILLFICLATAAYSQFNPYVPEWNNPINGTGNVSPRCITKDNLGNVIIAGTFTGTADFDPGAGTSNLISITSRDIFVAKYSTSGDYQWSFNLGAAYSLPTDELAISADASGNVVLTGRILGTVDFNPGVGVNSLAGNYYSLFVAKYSSLGVYQWAFDVGSNGSPAWPTGVTIDPFGNILLTGGFYSTIDLDPGPGVMNMTSVAAAPYFLGSNGIFVARYNPAGGLLWANRIDGSSAQGTMKRSSISSDASGNVFLTGYFQGNIDFGSGQGALTSNGNSKDIFIVRYNANGNWNWSRKIGSGGVEEATKIGIDSGGDVLIIGSIDGSVNFGGVSNLTSAGSTDGFLAKYNGGNGNHLWSFNIGSVGVDIISDLATDSYGNTFVSGSFTNTVDFDPGSGTSNLVTGGIGNASLQNIIRSECINGHLCNRHP